MRYLVTISALSVIPYVWKYDIEAVNFGELKTEILKRFGNLRATNKADSKKLKVKNLIRNSSNLDELLVLANGSDRWRLSIEVLG